MPSEVRNLASGDGKYSDEVEVPTRPTGATA